MTSALEKLLAPISAGSDCGEDISYDSAYQEVEKLILGKPETQFGAGEPPNWQEVRERCIPLLARSKHLRVFVMLAAALARVEGLSGFRDGISLLKKSVEKYWPNLYPRLDPEDNSDPTERVNIIASLTAPLATAGDPFNFLEALRACPLSDSPKYGRFSLRDIANSRAGVKPTPTM
ncbi:MAG: type VI secretion system ImpA family N-terminal domain-containing protein, partial [Verrucomicrobiota bacterium]|nr:type VI secretion system ImpA family N-terminal domain-containing protein [Verrucomicrobiota bacterium]